jgi:hypothetical protein
MARSKSSSNEEPVDDSAANGTSDKDDDGIYVAIFIAGALVGALALFLTESYDAQLKRGGKNAQSAS